MSSITANQTCERREHESFACQRIYFGAIAAYPRGAESRNSSGACARASKSRWNWTRRVILYLTYWYPAARRGKTIAVFMTAATLGSLIAGVHHEVLGSLGLHGWQWLFLVQGVPASVLGIVAFLYLKDKPRTGGLARCQREGIAAQPSRQ